MTAFSELDHTLLALLALHPHASGYELHQVIEESTGYMLRASFSQIYPSLGKLHEAGLADFELEPIKNRPGKKRYVLTDAHGNQSEVFFQIRGKKAVLPKDPFQGLKTGTFTTRGILVRSGDALSFDSLGCRIQMRAGNLYSTATLPFKRTVQTDPNRPSTR